MNNKKHSPIIIVALYIFVLYSFMPIVAHYVPSIIRTLLAIILWGYFIIPKMTARWIPFIIIPCLTLVEYAINSPSRIAPHLYYCFNLATLAALSCAIIDKQDIRLARHLVWLLVGVFIINAICTYYGNIRFPNASRLLASTKYSEDYYETFQRFNIGGFDVIYSMTLSIPLAAISFKLLSRGKKVFPILVTVLLVLAIKESQYTIALVCAVISLLLFLIPIKTRSFFLVIPVVVSLFFIVFENIPSVLSAISSFSGGEAVNDRISDISNYLQGNQIDDNSDVIGRYEYYLLSVKGFLTYPIIGCISTGSNMVGGHSFILDSLAKFGIFGIIALLIMYNTFYRKYLCVYRNHCFFSFVIVLFSEYVVLTFINPQPFIPFVSFALPLFLFVTADSENLITT